MKLLIQFPTRERPQRFKKYLLRYLAYMEDHQNFHIQVSCDVTDSRMNRSWMREFINTQPNTSIIFNNNQNKIQAINRNIPTTGWDVLLLASDDMWPVVRGYDTIIRQAMDDYFPDTDGVLHFNDGIHGPELNTLSIIGKKYYDRFGYVYNPEYKSICCDREFHVISGQLGRRKYFDDIIIRHLRKEVTKDKVHRKNRQFNEEDYKTLHKNLEKLNV